jgi:hypothetical protein
VIIIFYFFSCPVTDQQPKNVFPISVATRNFLFISLSKTLDNCSVLIRTRALRFGDWSWPLNIEPNLTILPLFKTRLNPKSFQRKNFENPKTRTHHQNGLVANDDFSTYIIHKLNMKIIHGLPGIRTRCL